MQEDNNSSLEEIESTKFSNVELNSFEKNNVEESKKVVRNIVIVAISNFIKLLAGILVGFVIPKIMGETNYGYYKVYTLYLGYVGLFHFGFIDGIYLIYAGKKFDQLNQQQFRTYSKFLFILELIISSIISIISLFFIKYDYGFIFLFIGLSLIATNITGYYQFISQITGRFKELSFRNLLSAILQIILIVLFGSLWYIHIINELQYQIYIISSFTILLIMTLWYGYTYRSITFGKSKKLKEENKNIIHFFIIGFPLLIANLVTNLILSIDKQFVSILTNLGKYTIGEFGVYSFAYTMLGVIATIIAAISTVLYPTIKTYDEERLKNSYNNLIAIIAMITSFCLLSYQPLCFIVTHWLSDYVDSLSIFRVILPGIILSSCVTMVMFNYYKAIGKHFIFFIISLLTLGLSIIANFIAYFATGKMIWISIASVFVICIWYIISEFYLIKKWKLKTSKNIIYISLNIASFYILTEFIYNIYLSFSIYFIVFVCLTLFFNFKLIKRRFENG